MIPDHDRRQSRPQTSDTAGWHSFDFIVRQALQVQRDIGTPGAVELLQNMGLNPQVIARVLSPERKIRSEDLRALAVD
ncbi:MULTISPECIES: hypothetical protein [unclassified Duganella]|jgi:hypothetical protein|uniref:hypothetical protein n=1 Tax=unclassified Duganella TaxID=2636909 RepID=UPI0008877A25|nr:MULTISPECIES: hypothetical protein [unclassified Duganella]SDG17447.1 hypothetical protein SAMN05216320_103138 [Duganella sp. OV458]SDJ30510.1 hypothetical protein SAMN05428973_103348 [Duganella sp. OV510]